MFFLATRFGVGIQIGLIHNTRNLKSRGEGVPLVSIPSDSFFQQLGPAPHGRRNLLFTWPRSLFDHMMGSRAMILYFQIKAHDEQTDKFPSRD